MAEHCGYGGARAAVAKLQDLQDDAESITILLNKSILRRKHLINTPLKSSITISPCSL
jgi:hypothetical protein